MNPIRFLKKCLTDRAAAWSSLRLVTRSWYGRIYWWLWPQAPLLYRLPTGGCLELYGGHSFTTCLWPAVDRYEPDVRGALTHFLQPGDTFIDCGANVGYFSVLAADLVGASGQVVSVEANPVTFELLKRNLARNECGTPIHCAVTSTPGDVDIFVSDLGDVYSSLKTGGLVSGESVRSYKVPGRTLDELSATLGLDRIDMVKVDIEGGELDVLSSARRLMADVRPIWIVEYGTSTWPAFGAKAADLLQLAAANDYVVQLFDPETGTVVPASPATWDSPYKNVLLLPSERLAGQGNCSPPAVGQPALTARAATPGSPAPPEQIVEPRWLESRDRVVSS